MGNEPLLTSRPVWPAGREREINDFVGFRAQVEKSAVAGPAVLRLATSGVYRAFVNGAFVGHGPARAAHGYYRVDEIDITDRLRPGRNAVAVEVSVAHVDSYYVLNQPAFVQAEVIAGTRVLAATGAAENSFDAFLLSHRIQKVQRYDQQRTFIEAYRLTPDVNAWRTDFNRASHKVACENVAGGKLLPRGVSYPDYAVRSPIRLVARGRTVPRTGVDPQKANEIALLGLKRGGFKLEEMTVRPAVELEYMASADMQSDDQLWSSGTKLDMAANTFCIADLGTNLTGFLGLTVSCDQRTRLYLTFDELLTKGDVDFKRNNAANVVYLELEPGTHGFETIEPYGLRFVRIAVDAACKVSEIHLRELANPDGWTAQFACSDPRFNRLFEAARETLRQNATDIFMDCPQRERAGWLCDSFFTARAALDLCGNTSVEGNFLQNYLLLGKYDRLPTGMLPMVYPADSRPNSFIPNWAMWFVLQLEEYLHRTNDRTAIDALRPKVLALVEYFKQFRNSDGLLENVDGWVFVEWSAANSFTKGVNYPTNMLYAAMLDATGRMYDLSELRREACGLREMVRTQSFDGEFFIDQAVRRDGKLEPTRNRTETCQYYAFFCGVASPESHGPLWRKLTEQFGPARAQSKAYPEIHPSNTFIGNVLRLEVLSRFGRQDLVLPELIDGYLYMAERTGTLWENVDPRASCNHGFASHVAHVLYRDVLGVGVDMADKTISVDVPDLPLDWCEGALPTPDGMIRMRWWKENGKTFYRLNAPFDLRVDDRGSPASRRPNAAGQSRLSGDNTRIISDGASGQPLPLHAVFGAPLTEGTSHGWRHHRVFLGPQF